jgi:alkanesulfonate monooxygenase SsuD/methylene tetrahydromethanopterin reductase-like flavin-dependent oxidoreductase (luciferase family)
MNTYDRPEAMARNFTATPRGLWRPEEGRRTVAQAMELAALADELGFDFVSVSEHHYMAGMCSPNPAVLAAALTRVVHRAGIALLGPLVSTNNPVRVAEEIAMLDQLSDGRLIALLLRGTPGEFRNANIAPELTRGRTEEAMLLIRKALTEPEPFAWQGENFDFPVISVWPGSTQQPHPPLFGSANSLESATFAATHRFGAAASFFGPALVAKLMTTYRSLCAEHGWQPGPDQTLYRAFALCGETPRHARELRERFTGGRPLGGPSTIRDPITGGRLARDAAPVPAADQAGFGFLQFCGDPGELVDQLRGFHELTGVGILDVSFNLGFFSHRENLEQVRRFGQEVLPALHALAPAAA